MIGLSRFYVKGNKKQGTGLGVSAGGGAGGEEMPFSRFPVSSYDLRKILWKKSLLRESMTSSYWKSEWL